jgi:hypothetical protein
VRIGKGGSPLCQSIHMRSLNLWMTSQRPDPIIEIVNGDEQNIGFVGIHNSRVGDHKRQQRQAEATPWKNMERHVNISRAIQ